MKEAIELAKKTELTYHDGKQLISYYIEDVTGKQIDPRSFDIDEGPYGILGDIRLRSEASKFTHMLQKSADHFLAMDEISKSNILTNIYTK